METAQINKIRNKKKREGTIDTTEDHKRVYKQLYANKMETCQKWTNS